MSPWRTTVTLTGTKRHVERTYSGGEGEMPGTEPKAVDTGRQR